MKYIITIMLLLPSFAFGETKEECLGYVDEVIKISKVVRGVDRTLTGILFKVKQLVYKVKGKRSPASPDGMVLLDYTDMFGFQYVPSTMSDERDEIVKRCRYHEQYIRENISK